jgi:hypothetical protein
MRWKWRFRGYVTPAGNKPVQDWFTSLPDEDAKDDARDTFGMLQQVSNALWRRPAFDQLDDGISEIRFDGTSGTYRLYGYFGPRGERQSYTLLHGVPKKRRRDPDAKRLASKRRDQIERKETSTHEFEFYERSRAASQPRSGNEGQVRSFSPGQIHRFPNSSAERSGNDESS